MKKILCFALLLMLGALAFGQTNVPPCDPNHTPPNCTDYFGVANWANSPLPTSTVAGTPSLVGNGLIARAYATDFATGVGTLGPVFVAIPTAVLPAGTLLNFQTWNQTTPGGSPTPSAGNVFHAYILRPTGTPNQYTVVFDSGLLTVPIPVNPAGEIAIFPVSGAVAVQAGDVIGFYGEGIPIDLVGTDVVSYPAPTPPLQGTTLTLGGTGFPFLSGPRTYSFAAAVGAVTVSGGMRKFMATETLPLPLANLSIAVPDTTSFPGSDYYVIALREYTTNMHTDLPPTKLRGYIQVNNGTDATGANTVPPPPISYLGPTILAVKNRPVRVLFKNQLPTGTGGNLFIPVDTTYMGAGMQMVGNPPVSVPYTQNRATLHLHGGATPWISDGTPHQWTVPVGETGLGVPQRGDSVQMVPDMWFDSTNGALIASCAAQPICAAPNATNDPGQGNLTFFWTNQQGGRLMFYHDHAYGLTRLNVYAGEAAGYLLLDPVEETALAAATVPGTVTSAGADLAHLVPLVIQDKTFVPSAAQLAVEDPTWTAGGFGTTPGVANPGDLWFPHVYTPNQNPADVGGANAFGRWDYGPWTLPGNQTLLLAATPTLGDVTIPCESSAFPNQVVQCPITPNPSGTPESFMDTPLVNGKAYPVLHVAPAAYRFRILSAGNDRSLNLQFYLPDPAVTTPDGRKYTEVKMLPAVPPATGTALPACTQNTPITNTTLFMGLATAILDASGNPINGTGLPANCWPIFGSGPQISGIPLQQTMWAADGRAGGVPDPTMAGPPFIQIGTEGGLLPAPVAIPSMPTGYEANTRSVTITNVSVHGLWLGPAERADAVVDFSQAPALCAAKGISPCTLILYNDAPTPAPAVDSRLDYFTGDGDQTNIGGAPNTLPGFGPNTRTIMQIVVDQTAPNTVPFSLATLSTALPSIFAQTQPVPIVPEPTYPPASGGYSATPTYSLITDESLTFNPIGSTTPVKYFDERKTIQELFTLDYGRMNATLGVELPLTNFLTQTTIPLGYIDPPTEIIKDGETQLWHITHNGVDTHFIHFHLFNVQVINRSAWDGTKRPPDENELGWKDTVRMNPLEDILVALKPIQPVPPFPLRDSYRLMDVTMPLTSDCPDLATLNVNSPNPMPCSIFTDVNPATNNPRPTPNAYQNFGWEYVWHCHILGHEESDMMRAIAFNVPPEAPSNLTVAAAATGLNLSWTDNSASETGFTLQRDTTAAFAAPTLIGVGNPAQVGPSTPTDAAGQGITWGGKITYNDTTATGAGPYFYRVQATKPLASYWSSGTVTSAWSNTVSFGGGPFAAISPAALAFGNVALNTPSAPQTVTISNAGTAPLAFTSLVLSTPEFTTPTNVCPNPLPANSTCTLTVAFTPAVAGPLTGTLTIGTNDPANPTLTVSLTGTGGTLPLLTITASNATMKYGSAVPIITPSYNPPNPVGLTPPTCSTAATSASAVGSYATTCSGAVSANYQITYVAGTVSVTQVPLTIWAPLLKMNVGGPVPTITPSYVGFVAGDTAATLAIAPNSLPTCTTTATITSGIGNYPITCAGAVDLNYTINYVNGTLTVTQGVLTITAPTLTMTYGGTVPALTPSYTVSGVPIVPVPPFTPPLCTTTATSTSPVGTYPVTCTGAVGPNYIIGYVAGTITIGPAPLTITAPSPTMNYGGPLPTLTPTYTGLVALDTPSTFTVPPNVAPTCTTTATINSVLGTYPVTCTGAVDANYTISYVAGTLTVNPAVVTVTASSASVTYGGTVPTITPAYSGFVLGQTVAVVTTAPTCSTTATSTSPASPPTYPSTCTGAVAPNYTFNYVAGAVTINGAPLTITANNASKVYGTTFTFSGTAFTSSGLLNGDTIATVTLNSTGAAATATVTAPGPNYPITPSAALGAGLGNYSITYVNGTLAVTPAPLTITANNASKTYGSTFTFLGTAFTSSGLLNSDTITSVTLTSTGAAAAATVVGSPYPIVPSAAVGTGLGNYTIGYVNGLLAVTQASSATTITSNLPNPSIRGQIVAVGFSVAPQFTGVPTGTVTVTAAPTGESCTGTLSAGTGSCSLTFATGGSRTLTATYAGDTNFVTSTSVPATQVVTSVDLSTFSLLFGNQLVGTTSAAQTVTLTNVGTGRLGIISITWTAPFSDSTNCPVGGSLAAGSSCRINVRFRPTATGVVTGTLTIATNDPGTPTVTVALTGTGVAAIAGVSPATSAAAPYDFGNVTRGQAGAPLTVTVTNSGNTALTFNGGNGFTLGGANPGQFTLTTGGSCANGGTLPALSSCSFTVNFTPTAGTARNTKNATVTIRSNATNGNQFVYVRGTAQ